MTSPDPTVPDEETPAPAKVLREVVGLLLMLVGALALLVLAYDVDPRLCVAGFALLTVLIGWRMTVAEE